MNIKIITCISVLFLLFNCSEPIKPDLDPPDQIQIKSIFNFNHKFVIKWGKCLDHDFKSYQLYESQNDDMSEEVKVFSSNSVNDTTAVLVGVEYNTYKYYRIAVTDISNNKSISPILRGSSYPIVLFESDRDGNDEIYIMDLNGNGLFRLTNNSTYDGWPRFSPDGSKFAFETDRDGNHEIYLFDFMDNNILNLTNSNSFDVDPYFTPDGSKIVFISDRTGHNNVYIMNVDGTNQTQLTNEVEWLHWPTVSPTGDKISVTSESKLYLMNIDGSDFASLATLPSYLGIPRFSQDGIQIAVSSNQIEIWSSSIILTNLQGEYKEYPGFHTPFYDPVEKYIYVGSYGGGIYKMDILLEQFTKLTEHDNDFVSSISSYGTDIAFISKRDGNIEVYSMNPDGSNQTNLTQNAAKDWDPQIQPQPGGF